MPAFELSAIAELANLDRFVQWDLVTLNPWDVPSIAAVGARLKLRDGEIWTSTTVGYAAKVRNIRRHPRVALMRHERGVPAVVLRGEATVVEGDGTENLSRLFELMGDPGGFRPLFQDTIENPAWRLLYREYWRRVLIRVRIVEVGVVAVSGLRIMRVAAWGATKATAGEGLAGSGRPKRPAQGPLDLRGRQMLSDRVPAVLALGEGADKAPYIVPVEARQDSGGRILVRAPVPLDRGGFAKSSLAVRVVDDSFELARMVAWIGRLAPGTGWREFETRSVYGFTKPPGWLPDVAAGLVATVMSVRSGAGREVTVPTVVAAAKERPSSRKPPLRLSGAAWAALERVFTACNATAPWYAGLAVVVSDPAAQAMLSYLAQRAELERDWAHALLLRGRRPVSPLALAVGALRMRPTSLDPLAEALRQERLLERSRVILRAELPELLQAGIPTRLRRDNRPQGTLSRNRAGAEAALALATSAAAALDRLATRRMR